MPLKKYNKSIEDTLRKGGRIDLDTFVSGISGAHLIMLSIEGTADKRGQNIMGMDLGYDSILFSAVKAFEDYQGRDHLSMKYVAQPPSGSRRELQNRQQPIDRLLMLDQGRISGIYSEIHGALLLTAQTQKVYQASGNTVIETLQKLNETLRVDYA